MPLDELLYIDVKMTLESLKGKAVRPGLGALEKALSELKEKFDQHVKYQKESGKVEAVESVDFNEEGDISKEDDGFKTVDLNSFLNSELDSCLETDSVTFSNGPLSTDSNMTLNIDHMALNTDHVTAQPSIKDFSADFPSKTPMFTNSSTNYLNEPDLDSTLIPNDPSSEHSDAESLPRNSSSVTSLGNEEASPVPLESLNNVSLKDDCQNGKVNVGGSISEAENGAIIDSECSSDVMNVSLFPEEVGSDFPMNHTRSLSRAIPPRVDLKPQPSLSGRLSEGNSESYTSVLSSSVGGQAVKISLSEPQSYEKRSSLDSELVQIPVKDNPDFANRVVAALSSFSLDDDGVIAVPVRSSSGG